MSSNDIPNFPYAMEGELDKFTSKLEKPVEDDDRLDWKKFSPRGKWIVVKADPRVKKTKGGIELPEMQLQAERVMEGTGHILKISPDPNDHKAIMDVCGGELLNPGLRIFFRGFLKDAFQGFTPEEDGQAIFLLRAEDVMGIVDEDVVMGAFQ